MGTCLSLILPFSGLCHSSSPVSGYYYLFYLIIFLHLWIRYSLFFRFRCRKHSLPLIFLFIYILLLTWVRVSWVCGTSHDARRSNVSITFSGGIVS